MKNTTSPRAPVATAEAADAVAVASEAADGLPSTAHRGSPQARTKRSALTATVASTGSRPITTTSVTASVKAAITHGTAQQVTTKPATTAATVTTESATTAATVTTAPSGQKVPSTAQTAAKRDAPDGPGGLDT